MKNNFDLTNYMKSNKVGAYQQLNEMWYQDIQPIGDNFTEAVVMKSFDSSVLFMDWNNPLGIFLHISRNACWNKTYIHPYIGNKAKYPLL